MAMDMEGGFTVVGKRGRLVHRGKDADQYGRPLLRWYQRTIPAFLLSRLNTQPQLNSAQIHYSRQPAETILKSRVLKLGFQTSGVGNRNTQNSNPV